MSWPTPQDYNEAIQSPQLNFFDPELKGGTVDTTNLGLPRPITGGFASVYRVRCNNREWAVRCFLREFADQQQRYESISKHLLTNKLPYTVGFDFLPQGIKVGGKWYPILKMEWVKGELLNKYIKQNLKNSAALLNLAEQWATMVKALQSAKIAHGDLQHGNILVVNGEFRLIDYDGMYVPDLTGQSSNEVGHRNYQHPNRTEFDFGPTIDNFASWVIYVSLLALSIDPTLWDQVKAGDEYLLFRREDFQEPLTSEILKLLSNHADQRLDSLASFFQSLLYSNPAQIPSLDGQPTFQVPSANASVINLSGGTKSKPSWLSDYVADSPSKRTALKEISLSENSTWVLDFINPPAVDHQKLLEVNVLKPRLILTAIPIICGLLIGGYFALALPIAVAAVCSFLAIMIVGVLIRDCYRKDPIVVSMLEVGEKEQYEKKQIKKLQQQIKIKENLTKDIRAKESLQLKKIDSQWTPVQEKERRDKSQIQTQLNAAIKKLNDRRQAINRNETEALRKLQDSKGAEIARINQNISSLTTSETNELSNTLRRMQDTARIAHLQTRSIDDATIPGVGPSLKARLRYSGIRSAADVEYWRVSRVDGIGTNKANALVNWRDHIASYARIPVSLSRNEVATIKAKYQTQKQQMESQRTTLQQLLNNEVNSVKVKSSEQMKLVNNEQTLTQNKSNQQLQDIVNQYKSHYETITQTRAEALAEANNQCQKLIEEVNQLRKKTGEIHWQLGKIQRDLATYKNVSLKTYINFVLGFRN